MKLIKYQKILVTHDGSKFSSAAFPHAQSLALTYNSEIILLHVVEPDESLIIGNEPSIYAAALEASKKTIKLEKQKARKQLDKLKIDFESHEVVKVTTYIKEGNAENVIIDVAKTEQCDVIVMSTHGRSGIARTFLGSVTDYVIRHAHCPVFVVHPIIPKKSNKKRRTYETKK